MNPKQNPDKDDAIVQPQLQVHPEDVQIARNAFRQHHDPVHAVDHLATVLEANPLHAEALALLNEIIAATPNPLELIKPAENGSILLKQAGMLAYIYFTQHNMDGTLYYLNLVYKNNASPSLPYFDWLLECLKTAVDSAKNKIAGRSEDTEIKQFIPHTLIQFLFLCSDKLDRGLSPAGRTQLEQLYPLINSYRMFIENIEDKSKITIALSIIVRKLGHVEEAIQLAKTDYDAYPTYMGAVVLGVGYLWNGQEEEALATYQEAHAIDPNNPSVLVDIGEVLCERGEFEKGLAAYRKALELKPDHDWAKPAYLYFQSVVEPDGGWNKKLKEYAEANPNNSHAKRFWWRIGLYKSKLPEPSEALINSIKNMLKAEKGTLAKSLAGGSTLIEAPSSYRAVQLLQQEIYGEINTHLTVTEIQEPDPRQPLHQVDFVLYRYNEAEPEPTLPAPDLTDTKIQEMLSFVAELATIPYESKVWWKKAGKYAQTLDTSHLNDLLSIMLYPPSRPSQFAMWTWLFRVQVAVALIIARLDEKAAWETSLRRCTLLNLAYGPMDWIVSAACIALCEVVEESKTGQEDTDKLYLELLENLPKPGDVPYEWVIIYCARYIKPSEKLVQVAQKIIEANKS
jgi:tetratricopeptide (TPR) repeat protein